MPLKGDINTFSLSAIVRLIHLENKTGALKVTSGEHSASLYFNQGKIVFISGDITEDLSLDSFLKARNIINEEDIRQMLEISAATGKRFETLLLEEEYIPQNKLANILRQQFKEVIATVMTWEEGEYNYADGPRGHYENLNLEIDPIRMMTEARKWKEYRTLIPDDEVVFQINTGGFKPDSHSSDSASRVILLIDGQRSVSQIIAETGLPRPAVYKALTTLASHGAIIREKMTSDKAEANRLSDAAIIKFYLNILHEMTAGLAVELGSKKAVLLVEKSFKRTPYHDLFLFTFQPNADVVTNFHRIDHHLCKQKISKKDLINGFNLAIGNLLQEEYQLLGLIATQNMVNQVVAGFEFVPHGQKSLAQGLRRFLDKFCDDEDLLRGIKSLSAVMSFDHQLPSNEFQSISFNLDDTGGTTIIAFYSKAIQLVAGDLESEIGTKILDLFQDIAMSSEYYDAFLSQFDIKDNISSNVYRIRDHINTKGLTLSRQGMVIGFQQVLLGLFQEEHRLLGNKATRKSLRKLKEHLFNSKQKNYMRLANQLFEFLKNSTIRAEDTEAQASSLQSSLKLRPTSRSQLE